MEEEIRNDQELYSYYRDRTTTLTKDNFMYLMSHPEVKRLLNDYLSNILLHKPDDVFKFTKDYFKFLSDKGESDKFVVLVGPNSVGKTTLINKICEDFPENFETPKHIVTNNKENCINVSKEEFMDGINNKTIIVYSYDNKENEYEGISKEEIDRINNSGKIAILEIDLKGAKTINNSSVDANFIGVLPPSMDALRVRIKQNTKLNTASINNVLEFAEKEVKEIENLTFFGFRIMNDELETGYKDMKNAIISLYPFLKYKPEDIEAIKNGKFGRDEE
jgi:guanylate kinase